MTPTLISVEEYLATSFEDGDREYIDGEIQEINVGNVDHSRLQSRLASWFEQHWEKFGAIPLTEVRIRVSPTRCRLPDVTVVLKAEPEGDVITEPPFLVIEILSPDDRDIRIQQMIDDYLRFGIPWIWVIDPKTCNGHIYTGDRRIAVSDAVFRTQNPDIEIDLRALPRRPPATETLFPRPA